MERWTEAQWRDAEWQDPTKIYLPPEIEDGGVAALLGWTLCFALSVILASVWLVVEFLAG
jgi:hypothetical protein